jgi:hypothetical protein
MKDYFYAHYLYLVTFYFTAFSLFFLVCVGFEYGENNIGPFQIKLLSHNSLLIEERKTGHIKPLH